MSVSVLVITYNPIWEKLKATLKSILKQKDIRFEIIISDDGSKINEFDKVRELFSEYNFRDYKLIGNATNNGTVANVLIASAKSSGEYVRPISPGDLLYNEYVLRDSYELAKKSKSDILFGNMICYKRENDRDFTIFRNVSFPKYPAIYGDGDWYGEIIANILLADNISGASILVKNDVYRQYVSSLRGVKYAEDMFMKIALLERKKIDWIDSYVLYYEYNDGGISTTSNNKWSQLLQNDYDKANDIIMERARNLKDNRLNRYIAFSEEKNKIKKEIRRLFLPQIRKIKHKINKNKRVVVEDFSVFFYSCWND